MTQKFQIRNSLIDNRIYLVRGVTEKKGYALASDTKRDVTEECKKAVMCWLDQEIDRMIDNKEKKGIILECPAGTLTFERKTVP